MLKEIGYASWNLDTTLWWNESWLMSQIKQSNYKCKCSCIYDFYSLLFQTMVELYVHVRSNVTGMAVNMRINQQLTDLFGFMSVFFNYYINICTRTYYPPNYAPNMLWRLRLHLSFFYMGPTWYNHVYNLRKLGLGYLHNILQLW